MIPTSEPKSVLAWGWNVFPALASKRPMIPSWKQFQQRRVSVAEVLEWQRDLRPRVWAVVTGAISGLVVLDFDGEAGNATMQRLELLPHVRTGTGGHHVYIRYPGFRVPTLNGKSKKRLAEVYAGLDVKRDGGYAIFSGHNEEGAYLWLRQPDPDPFENLPPELRQFLAQCGSEAAARVTPREAKPASNGRVAADRIVSEALRRAPGGRNDAGVWLATQLRDNGYSEDESTVIAREYAGRVPGFNAKGEPESYSEREALASVRQAYSRQPRHPWSQVEHEHGPDVGSQSATAKPSVDCADVLSQYYNDHGNAERLIALNGRDLRYDYAIKRWRLWDGKRWRIDDAGQAYKLAKLAMLRFLEEAVEADDKAAVAFGRRSLNHKLITALLASAECELPVGTHDLDRHPYLL